MSIVKIGKASKKIIDWQKFSIETIGVFTPAEVSALKTLKIETMEDLRKFRGKINKIEHKIQVIEGSFIAGLQKEDAMKFLKIKIVNAKKWC